MKLKIFWAALTLLFFTFKASRWSRLLQLHQFQLEISQPLILFAKSLILRQVKLGALIGFFVVKTQNQACLLNSYNLEVVDLVLRSHLATLFYLTFSGPSKRYWARHQLFFALKTSQMALFKRLVTLRPLILV